jgi:AcrR family transcriptional regulator
VTTTRERILDATERLLTARGELPSLDAVAAEAGVSKGGLLYHFDKESLLVAVVERAVGRTDERLASAAHEHGAAAAWLRLSVPDEHDRGLYRALLSALRVTAHGTHDLTAVPAVAAAEARWTALLEAELGDPVLALMVRLIGDGLLWSSVLGTPPDPGDVTAIIERLGLAR